MKNRKLAFYLLTLAANLFLGNLVLYLWVLPKDGSGSFDFPLSFSITGAVLLTACFRLLREGDRSLKLLALSALAALLTPAIGFGLLALGSSTGFLTATAMALGMIVFKLWPLCVPNFLLNWALFFWATRKPWHPCA
jgi:hypothetical protein